MLGLSIYQVTAVKLFRHINGQRSVPQFDAGVFLYYIVNARKQFLQCYC